jgi:hypothetical protein
MEKKNYKIIENRADLSNEQIVLATSFVFVLGKVSSPKGFPFATLVIGGLAAAAIVAGLFVYINSEKAQPTQSTTPAIDTVINIEKEEKPITASILKTQPPALKAPGKIGKDTGNKLIPVNADVIEVGETDKDVSPALPFTAKPYADIRNAISIKDSIYGPVNVSRGYGDYKEYIVPGNIRATESNSAWFTFRILRDTLLTFHIVPNLKTDDYDFDLFKCEGSSCIQDIASGKIKPVRSCLSWNTSQNCNTGLSNRATDTTCQALDFKGIEQGKTYASGIKVKGGDVFYLLVNAPAVGHQDPEGFVIYFYNYLPKIKANNYNK